MDELEKFLDAISTADPGLFEEAGGPKARERLICLRNMEKTVRVIVQHRHRFEEFDLDGSKKAILDKLQKEVEA